MENRMVNEPDTEHKKIQIHGSAENNSAAGFCPYCMSPVAPDEVCPVCGLTQGAYQSAPHHLPPGTILSGRYLVGRVLGEGGFGITYIGCDLRLEMKVAIKEYFPSDHATRLAERSLSVVTHTAGDGRDYEKGLKRFLVEARTMARMEKQPEIVMVRDFFEANNTAYIVMEYVDGTTFSELVEQRGGKIAPEELFPAIEPLFNALGNVHKTGLLHRDISPDNLMLEQGKIRLLDFGCAREVSTGNETLTVALKQGYGPIEQYQKKGQGPWTDVYALSATIYFCLTGKKPPQALDRTLEDELVPPRKLGVAITMEQQKALLKGLEVNPKLRYQSVEELHAGLYDMIPQEIPLAPVPTVSDEKIFPDNLSAVESEKPDGKNVQELKSAESGETSANQEETAGDSAEDNIQTDKEETAKTESGQSDTDEIPACTAQTDEGAENQTLAAKLSVGMQKLRGNRAAGLGIAAAVVILAVFIVCLNIAGTEDTIVLPDGSETAQEENGGSDGNDTEETTADGFDKSFTNAVEVSSEDDLRAAMDNDDVTSVVIADFIEITGEQLEITKPVRILPDQTLRSDQAVIVSRSGFVDVQGGLCVEQGLLYCKGNSCVVVEDGGSLNAWKIWAACEENISLAEGASIDVYGADSPEEAKENCLFLDEDGLFLDARQVSTKEELLNALDDSDTEAVRVAAGSEIVLSEDEEIYQTVPVLIEEGASVTIPQNSTSNGDQKWFVDGTVLINYGNLTASLQGFENGEIMFVIVNYGEMDLGTLRYDNGGSFINTGNLELETASVFYGDFTNLGTAAFTGGEETWFFDFRENVLFNYGTLTLTGREEAEACISVNNRLVNAGTIKVCEYACLYNCGIIENKGTIALNDSTAAFNSGEGWVQSASTASCILAEDESNISVGVLIYSDKDTVAGIENFIDQTVSGRDYGAEIASTQSELERALESWQEAVLIEGGQRLTVEGDLTVNKRVIIYGDLNVEGTLTVGEGGKIIAYGSLTGGSIVVADGVLVACRGDFEFAEVEIKDGMIAASPYGNVEIGSSLTVGTGEFLQLGSLELSDAEISIEDGGYFCICATLSLTDCDVAVAEGGEIHSRFAGDFSLDEGSTLINYGNIDINSNHWLYNIDIAGSVQNYGRLNLDADMFPTLSGSLTNYGKMYVLYKDRGFVVTGTLDNQGELYIDTDGNGDGDVEIVTDGGTFTGNAAMAGSAY